MTDVHIVIEDVLGRSPAKGDRLWVRAARIRTGAAGQVIAPVAVPIEVHGSPTVDLEPGPARIRFELRDLAVDQTREFPVVVPESGPVALRDVLAGAYDWSPVEIEAFEQILDAAVVAAGRSESAAGRAEVAADGVDAAIAGAADQVLAAVESDRVEAEVAASAAAGSAAAASGSASAAAGSASDAVGSASAASSSATDAGTARDGAMSARSGAESARDAAVSSATAAGTARDGAVTARDAAAGHAGAASSHADAAAGSAAAASGSESVASTKATAAAGSASEAADALAQVLIELANSQAYQDVVSAIGDMSSSWNADIQAAISALVDQAPETLDTLAEVAAALGNDPNFATTVMDLIGQKVSTTDPRLSDARPPTAHTHSLLQVDGLGAALDGKADVGHGHTWEQVSGKPGTFPSTIALVAGLQAALDGKSASEHTHTKAQVGLGNVDNTSDASKPVSTAVQAALSPLQSRVGAAPATWRWNGTTLPTSAAAVHAQARAGDFIVCPNLTTNPGWHQITGV